MEQHSFFRTFRQATTSPLVRGMKPSWPAVLGKLLPLRSCFYDTGESGGDGQQKSITYRRYDLHRVSARPPGGSGIETSVGSPSPRPGWSSAEPLGSSLDDLKSGLSVHRHPYSSVDSSSCAGFSVSPVPLLAFKGPPSGSLNYADDSAASSDSSTPPFETEESVPRSTPAVYHLVPEQQRDQVYQVRLEPDSDGLFGLNLRYQNYAGQLGTARLSRLLPDSSADLCYPRLRVGDELLDVDGQPVQCFKSQDELVRLFRQAAGLRTPVTLSLRRRSRLPDSEEEEDEKRPLEYVHFEGAANMTAEESVDLLAEGLRTGRILSRFELLYKSRPELSSNAAKKDVNVLKNRYADIYPYDCNRIVLVSSARSADANMEDGQDYINASYVTMPSGRTVSSALSHYIATQGPLPHTAEDFWSMVWQERVRTVAMVTPEEERGRIKCHRYWPGIFRLFSSLFGAFTFHLISGHSDEDEIVRVGDLVVSCQFVRHSGHFIHRQLLLTHGQVRVRVKRCVVFYLSIHAL